MPRRALVGSERTLRSQVEKGGDVDLGPGAISLTQPLVIEATGTHLRGQDTTLVWNGLPDHPMVVNNGAMFTGLTRLRFLAGKTYPSAAIELLNAPLGRGGFPTFGNKLSQIRIGERGKHTMDYGLVFTGDVNGDSNLVECLFVFGVAIAGVAMLNPQAVGNEFNTVGVYDSPVGFQARGNHTAAKALYGPFKNTGRNWGFGNMADTDLDIGPNAGIDVTGYWSEGSHRMVRSSGGGVAVRHGYWQRGANAVPEAEGVLLNANEGGYRSYVHLEDFDFTYAAAERIVGWPRDQQFVSNVANLAVVA